jgi:hypothetical protein
MSSKSASNNSAISGPAASKSLRYLRTGQHGTESKYSYREENAIRKLFEHTM